MFKLNLKSERGFSLTEIMIAMGIMAVVAFGGFQAYEYFVKQTKKEASKMDDLSEFNLLTKDLLKFAEGAGISTAYLNLPIKVKDCDESEPCLKKLVNESFKNLEAGEIPPILQSQTCIQFFRDANAVLDQKKAYPDKIDKDKVFEIKDMEIETPTVETFATWTLKDENSPPIILMKSREGGVVMNLIRQPTVEVSIDNNINNVRYALYQSDAPLEEIMKVKEYPFLIYNSLYNNHYVIQQASDIISCGQDESGCKTLIEKISRTTLDSSFNGTVAVDAGWPSKVYAIKFDAINFSTPFFQNVLTQQKLPADCKTSWGDGKQPADNYFFPSFAYSVWQESGVGADLAGPDAVNILNLSHYYTTRGQSNTGKGLMVALPIDIFSYKVEKQADGKTLSLVSELWHATEIKKKTKIFNLKGPFSLTRKLGSPELGIWYNPLKSKPGGTP